MSSEIPKTPIRPVILTRAGAIVDENINQPADKPALESRDRLDAQRLIRSGVVENELIDPRSIKRTAAKSVDRIVL